MEHLNLTVRALTVLKALGVNDEYDLYDKDIPVPGTIVRRSGFFFIPDLAMCEKAYKEITELKDHITREIDRSIGEQMAQQMLDHPEDYGLIWPIVF